MPGTVIFAGIVGFNLFSIPFAIAQEEGVRQKTEQHARSSSHGDSDMKEKAEKEYEIETITVTAEKREENIQDIPVSVTALSDIRIEDAGITNIEELSAYIPNLQIHQFGPRGSQIHPYIRGVGSLLGESALGFYVDGISYLNGASFNTTDFFDIERIKFLRGPQGTLYGKNALGGVINIITKKPTNDLKARADLSFGDYSYQRYHAGLNVPIIKDRLFFNLSGLYAKRNGFIENDLTGDTVDDREELSGRTKLRWMPTDSLDVILGFSGDRIRDGSYALGHLELVREKPRHVSHDFTDGYSDSDQTQENLQIVYDAPWFTITSITGMLQYSIDSKNDQDFTPDDLAFNDYKLETDQFTQEIRFSSPEDKNEPYAWLVGAYLFNNKRDRDSDDVLRPDAYNLFSEGALSQIGLEIESHDLLKANMKNKGEALFGQATYTFFDKLDLTAGLRYESEEKTADIKSSRRVNIGGQGAPFLPDYLSDPTMGHMLAQLVYEGTTADINDKIDFSEWLPKFSAAYHLNDQIMTYASAAKGFRSGGFNENLQVFSNTDEVTFDPEYSWNYELGVKSGWLNNRLIANAAVFYIDYEDQQVLQLVGANQTITKNAGKSTSMGFEVELTAKPVKAWN